MAEDELPVFDGIGSAWQFWNSRGTPEAQRLAEASCAFSGRSLIWFQLWSLRNPKADWDTFHLALLHQFQPDKRPILPEICWKEVKDWEIEWVEMRAKLLQQPAIDPESTKSQIEQEITAASAEIQAKIEEDQEIAAAEIQEESNSRSQSQPLQQQGTTKVSYQENFQTIQIHTNSSSQLQVE
ncbi:hypothetical protein PIB30_016591 [Stylosanthes scabra]|uniref:Uncharacterized protein n=1 Tax=Stylosanthes scabra TaxID=79078 RepID=A0ABU6T735_9FABA|nr:hypothetical protein [Stylosanthes scabra]